MSAERGESGPLQWPFVGLAVLLVLLVLATPGLLGLGKPTAGSLGSEPVLDLYRSTAGNATHFYVHGVTSVAYAQVDVGLARLPSWPGPLGGVGLAWSNWTNQTDTLSVSVVSAVNPVAVNVSVEFVDPSGMRALYVGVYVFNVSAGTVYLASLLPALNPGLSSLAVTDLPQSLPLLARTPGVP